MSISASSDVDTLLENRSICSLLKPCLRSPTASGHSLGRNLTDTSNEIIDGKSNLSIIM